MCIPANATNQALLQTQYDFREITEPIAERVKRNFAEELNETRNPALQQQAHYALASTKSSN